MQLKIAKWQLYALSKTSLKRFVPVERAGPVGTADLGSAVPARRPNSPGTAGDGPAPRLWGGRVLLFPERAFFNPVFDAPSTAL